jgi:hypothetical protein
MLATWSAKTAGELEINMTENETKPERESSRLATALRCAAQGLPIVQLHEKKKNGLCTCGREDCKRPGRHPRTENDIVNPTTDAAIIRENWTQRPNAAIALATGAEDIVAVMITTTERLDPIHADRWRERADDWRAMEGEHGLPHTVMFRRGDRDVLLFKTPRGSVLNGKLQLAEGVTIFGKGRYVRLPGSFDPEGKDRFDPGCAVGDVDIAPMPKWLARMIRLRAGGDREARNPSFERFLIPFDSISVATGVPCKAEKVTLMAESMRVTGIRKPLTVRQVSGCSFALLSDPHELAAMKSLHIECCECTVLLLDETDGQLWQLAELIRQPDLSPLDWAEAIMKWVRLVREKGAQVGHPVGSPQPHDKGFSETERVRGVSRSEVQRAEKIASISDAAKAEIRRLNLRVKRDMVKIGTLPPDQQVAAVHELAGPKDRTVTLRGGAPRKDPQSKASDPASPAEESKQAEATQAEDEPEGRDGNVVESPKTAPDNADGLDIPPALPRTDGGERQYEAFKSRWVQYCAADFAALPAAIQATFATELTLLTTGKGEWPR